MRFAKFIGLFIIVLVVSLNFSGSCLYAEENKGLGDINKADINSTNGTNSSDINYIQVNLSGQLPYYMSPSQLGDDFTNDVIDEPYMAKPVMNTPNYNPPRWNPPGVRKKHWYNFFGWLWDCCCYGFYCLWFGIACTAYTIAYAVVCVGYAVWFTIQMVAWFFVIIVWVPVAIVQCGLNIKDFGNAFTLFSWCFTASDNLQHKDASRVVNIANETVKYNMTVNNSSVNTDNISNSTGINESNTLINNESNVIEVNKSVDINKYLLDHHLSSFSNSSLENVTDKNLTYCINSLNKQNSDIKKTFLLLNTLFEAVNNVIALIETLVNIITCIAAGLSVPTEGSSVPAAAGAQVAKETAKITFQGILKGIIMESVSTMLWDLESKLVNDDYYTEGVKDGTRGVIISKRITDTVSSIKKGEKVKAGKGFFDIVCDTVGMLCTIAELVWSINSDIEVNKIKDEQDYRCGHHLVVC
jgi:hypothetical protein